MRLYFKKRCTCGSNNDKHFLSCDLFYMHGKSAPKKRKRFFIFYPLKRVEQ